MIKIILLLCLLSAVYCKLKVDFETNKITQLQGQKDVGSFIKGNQVRVVYYYKKDVKFLKFFFKELEKSTEFLEMYGVKTGFCNCTDDMGKDVSDCRMKNVENSVHTYRSGTLLLSLELETMFDVNSIMSNILQLVMLREVPILQTAKEVEKYLGTMRGKKDVVFGHMKAIGTFDHRVFMEVAYAYMNLLQFVICTDKKATKLFEQPATAKDVSTVWWVWTKTMSPTDTSYHNIRYRWELNLKALANFVKTVTKPKMFGMPEEGLEHPYSSFEIPVVRFYYSTASELDIHQKASVLTKYYGGHIGVVLINMDHEDVGKVTTYSLRTPVLSVQNAAKVPENFLPLSVKLTIDNIVRFIEDSLGGESVHVGTEEPIDEEVVEESAEEEPADNYEAPPFNYEDVEKQDDRVAEVVDKTKKFKMPLDLVPALTDKTFPGALKELETAVILLYFPFDAVSMGNLRMFGEAADMMGKQTTLKIARVNCYDWTDVCQNENIIAYPTLRVYKKGEKAWDYKGPQDTQAMFSTFKLLEMDLPVYEADSKKLMQYLTGQGENTLTGITNTTVVGLFRKGDKQEKEVFQQLAVNSGDRILFVYSDAKDAGVLAEKFSASVPAVILAKYDDSMQPYAKFDGKYTLHNLQDFVEKNKLPKLTELTPLMLPEIRKQFSDLLILFTDGSDRCQQSEDSVREIVKAQQFNNVSFNLMQVPDDASVGFRVLQQYARIPVVPHLSVVKFQKGEVFNFVTGYLDKESVTTWLSSVVEGSEEPASKLKDGEWKPKSKGYEFLKIIDWEAKNRKEEKPRSDMRDDVPEDHAPKNSGPNMDPSEENIENKESMEEEDDTGTRKDLFALRDSRLYHQAPGRSHLHGDRKEKGGNSGDEGYSSGDDNVKEVSAGQIEDESIKKQKKHDPSEL